MSVIDMLPRDGKSRTEEEVERIVEKAFDALDARYLAPGSTMTQDDYLMEVEAIHNWANIENHFGHRVEQ